MKILIVDDEPGIRGVLRVWFEREGFTVVEAENGKVGIEVHQQTPVELMVCDLIMPVKEGIETISYFRRNYPTVGIIAISGGGRLAPDGYLELAQQLGAWKIFSKPLNMPAVVKAVKEWGTRS